MVFPVCLLETIKLFDYIRDILERVMYSFVISE